MEIEENGKLMKERNLFRFFGSGEGNEHVGTLRDGKSI
jgi:hypothetical protein